MKELRSVDVSGSGDIDILESISVPELSLSVNGSGDISAENISVDKIMVKVNGSGDVDIAGTTSTAGLTVSGSGDIDASLSGIKHINAAIYGSGDITLSGNSAKGTFVSNGSGDFNATKMIIQDLSATSNGSGDIDCYCKGTFSGSAIDVERRKPVLSTVTGGLSGPCIRPIAVRMVWQVAKSVKIPVIGLGGIMNGRDALEFIMAGASAVEIGSANFVNPAATMQIIDEITDYCQRHGVTDISELRGIV